MAVKGEERGLSQGQGKATWPRQKEACDHSFITQFASCERRGGLNSARSQKNSFNWIFTHRLSLTLTEANCRTPEVIYQRFQGMARKGRYIAYESSETYLSPYYFFITASLTVVSFHTGKVKSVPGWLRGPGLSVTQADCKRPAGAGC